MLVSGLLSVEWWSWCRKRKDVILDVLVRCVLITLSFTEDSRDGEPARFGLKGEDGA